MKKGRILLLFMFMLTFVSASAIDVTSIVVNSGSSTTIDMINGSLQMNAVVLPSNADDLTYTWSVTNGTGQAAITNSGLLVAQAVGNVTVKATANDGSGTTGTLAITITNQLITSIPLNTLNNVAYIGVLGDSIQILATPLPSNAIDNSFTWSVVPGTGSGTISLEGYLKAVTYGTVTVIATANDASATTGSFNVTISEFVTQLGVEGVAGATTITTDGGTLTLTNDVQPVTATNPNYNLSITNGTGYASVDNVTGVVTAISNGTVTLVSTALDNSGIIENYQITISNQTSFISIDSIQIKSAAGYDTINVAFGTILMTAIVWPNNATVPSINWNLNTTGINTGLGSLSNITTVNPYTFTAELLANENGNVSVEVEAAFGTKNRSRSIHLMNQIIKSSSISINGQGNVSEINSALGTLQMEATILPLDATDLTYTWSVTPIANATINPTTGLLTAITDGTVTVTATPNDGFGTPASLDILLNNLVSSISIQGALGVSSITAQGGTLQMDETVLGLNNTISASNPNVIWSVTNSGNGASTINATGLLSAFGNETVTVKATSTDGTNVSATTTISITNQTNNLTSLNVTAVGGNYSITVIDQTMQMIATTLPSYVNDNSVSWSVTNVTGQASIDANGLVTPIANGSVIITATANDNSALTDNAYITISDQALSISNNEKNIFSVYPVPATSTISISSNIKCENIKIISTEGKIVRNINVENNYLKHTINIDDLTKGSYFIIIETKDGIHSNKFIKQ